MLNVSIPQNACNQLKTYMYKIELSKNIICNLNFFQIATTAFLYHTVTHINVNDSNIFLEKQVSFTLKPPSFHIRTFPSLMCYLLMRFLCT